jgi:hypothetical protein
MSKSKEQTESGGRQISSLSKSADKSRHEPDAVSASTTSTLSLLP